MATPAGAVAKRPHIPDAVKAEVWKRDCGNVFETKCPIAWCTERVSWRNFVLAHDIPFSRGGATDASNLCVTCASCNLGMSNRYTVTEWRQLGAAPGPPRSPAPAGAAPTPRAFEAPTRPPPPAPAASAPAQKRTHPHTTRMAGVRPPGSATDYVRAPSSPSPPHTGVTFCCCWG